MFASASILVSLAALPVAQIDPLAMEGEDGLGETTDTRVEVTATQMNGVKPTAHW